MNSFIGNKNRELSTVQWVAAQIPEAGATVYGLDLNLTMAHYTTLRPVQVYYETPATLAARLPKDAPSYALFNVPATETQWKGKVPGQIYHWLLDGPGLAEIGRYGDYTLFRVLNPQESSE